MSGTAETARIHYGWQGRKPCGCVTWLYSGVGETPAQQERAIRDAIKSGLTVTPIEDPEEARLAWGKCPHQAVVEDPAREARRLVAEARA